MGILDIKASKQNKIGEIYLLRNQHTKAEKSFAFAADSEYSPAMYNLGKLYLNQGKIKQAQDMLEKAASQHYAPAYIALGELYLNQGNIKLALEVFAYSCKNSNPEGCEKLSSIANSTYIKNHFPDIFELLAGEAGNQTDAL